MNINITYDTKTIRNKNRIYISKMYNNIKNGRMFYIDRSISNISKLNEIKRLVSMI